MFANQRALQVPALKQAARALGIDGAKFDQCLDSGKHTANVRADYELGEKMGVNSTPTIYINGRPLVGAQPFEQFKLIIDEELAAVSDLTAARLLLDGEALLDVRGLRQFSRGRRVPSLVDAQAPRPSAATPFQPPDSTHLIRVRR